jgi:galactonate dehydratase
MKITEVKYVICQGGNRNWSFVKISTDKGIVGWGEATAFNRAQVRAKVIEFFEPMLIGEDPFNIEKIWQKLYIGSYVTGKDLSISLSGVETALWDIVGKALNTPVYNLLGGRSRDKIKLYFDYCDAYGRGFCGTNTWHKGDDSLEGIAKQANYIKEQNFTALKLHPVGLPLSATIRTASLKSIIDTVEKVKVIREAVGDEFEICMDLNGSLDVYSSIRLAKALEPYRIMFLEDPVRQDESPMSYRRIKETTSTPIGTGENLYNVWAFRNYLEIGAIDVVLLDVVHCGGILHARKIAALAEAYHLPIAPHNPNGPLATIISAHFCASIPNLLALEYYSLERDAPWRDKIIDPPLKVVNGYLELPTGPGWGVEIIEEEVARHPYREAWYSGLSSNWEGWKVQ